MTSAGLVPGFDEARFDPLQQEEEEAFPCSISPLTSGEQRARSWFSSNKLCPWSLFFSNCPSPSACFTFLGVEDSWVLDLDNELLPAFFRAAFAWGVLGDLQLFSLVSGTRGLPVSGEAVPLCLPSFGDIARVVGIYSNSETKFVTKTMLVVCFKWMQNDHQSDEMIVQVEI